MRRSPSTGFLAALSLVAVLAACAGQDDPTAEEVQADVSEELQAYDTDLTADQADCIAEIVVEEVGVDELNDIDFSADEPDDLAEAFGGAAVSARAECLDDPGDEPEGEPGTDTTETDADAPADTETDPGAGTGTAGGGTDAPE